MKQININNKLLNNSENLQIQNYHRIISNIVDQISDKGNNILNIVFDSSKESPNEFVHPLFIILLLNLYDDFEINERYKEQNIKITIDIKSLEEKVQKYILTYLTQFIDCDIVEIAQIGLLYTEALIYGLEQSNKSGKSKILLHTTVKGNNDNNKDNNLTLLKEQEYNYLPIVKITNNNIDIDFISKDYWITNKTTNKKELVNNENRKHFYKKLQRETKENGIYKDKNDKLFTDIFVTYLAITDNKDDSINGFKDILLEMIDNIQKHAKYNNKLANGHIAFYKNSHDQQNEFIVCDDYSEGFLETYLKTMKDEKEEENISNTEAIEEYDSIIKDLENNKNIEVLEKIFSLDYIFAIHKKRIKKHFGFPLLLKLLAQLDKHKNQNKTKLTVYVHRKMNTYHIVVQNAKVYVTELKGICIKGTYIHISFPFGSKIKNDIFKNEVLNVHTYDYRTHFINKEIIKKSIKSFILINYTQLINKELPKEIVKDRKEEMSLYLKYDKSNIISNFLRSIYSYAYIHETSIKDIVVLDFPIKKQINYLEIYRDTSSLKKISNILFLDNTFPRAMFIGGKSENQMCLINNMLCETFNYDKTNFLKNNTSCDEKINVNTNLFYKDKDKDLFIPLELFLPYKNKEKNYTGMIDNYLELKSNYENIHLDTNNNSHLKKFYYFKHIFEDSTWVNRISFDLALRIENDFNIDKIVFIGIERYSSLILSIVKTILSKDISTFIIEDLNNKNIEQYENFKISNENKSFIIFSPVTVYPDKIERFIENVNSYFYCFLKLKYEFKKELKYDWTSLFEKNINSIISKADNCDDCNGGIEKPLYKIDKDKYNIQNFFKYQVEVKRIEKKNVSWINAIEFGHTKRGRNHYLYYIKTVQFLKNNITKIKSYFSEKYISNSYDKSKIPVILSSNHDSNSDFISIIDNIIFENNAIIHSFNLFNKEQNIHSLEKIKIKYNANPEKYEFFFIDDVISSGATLEYFYHILKYISKEDKFKSIFSLVDRTDENEKLFILSKYYNNYFAFFELHIKPIKIGFEDCYLCEREKNLKNLIDSSSLVFIKNKLEKKAENLELKIFEGIEYKSIEQVEDFKNYLKMHAVEHIYKRISIFTDIEDEMSIFINDVEKYFDEYYLNSSGLTKEIKKIIKFEAKIAFIKTLSFPKISFIEKIRELVHFYIIKELKNFIIEDISTRPHKVKTPTINLIVEEQEINNIRNNFICIENIVNFYEIKSKTNIDYFNFLISTASYLNVNYIISLEMITFYHKLTKRIKYKVSIYSKYKRLLTIYPIAVKVVTSYSKEKSLYFNMSLRDFFKDYPLQYNGYYSRIFGLFVENTKYLESYKNKFLSKEINYNNELNDVLIILRKEMLNFLKEIIINKKISFFIDTNQNISNINLVDIFNKYDENEDENVNLIYKGATIDSDKSEYDIILKDKGENKYNIWCNFHKNSKTYIRITQDYCPLGIVVIEHDDDLNSHLLISRKLLMVQNNIIDFFHKHLLLAKIIESYIEVENNKQEKILAQMKLVESEKEKKILSSYLSNYNHNIGGMLNFRIMLTQKLSDHDIFPIRNNKEILKTELQSLLININELKDYAFGLPYIAEVAQIGYKDNKIDFSNSEDFFMIAREMRVDILKFLNIAYISGNSKISNETINYKIIINDIDCYKISGALVENIRSIIFELCYNAGKYNNLLNNETCIIRIFLDPIYNSINILNNRNKKDFNKKNKIGLESINKYFNKIKHELVSYSNMDNDFKIIIKGL